MMKKLSIFISSIILALSVFVTVQAAGPGTITQLDQFVSTTSPSTAITQRTYGKAVQITGLTNGQNLCLNATGILTTTGCASGGLTSYDAFTHPAVGQSATTSQINVVGLLSTASTTIVGNATTTGSQAASYFRGTGTATSTFSQPISFTYASSTATSTLSGVNLPYGGCYAVNGVCVGGTVANTLANGLTATTTFYANGLVYSDGTKLTQPATTSTLYFNPATGAFGFGTTTPKGTIQVAGSVVIGKAKNGFYPYLPTVTNNPLSSGATAVNVTDTAGYPTGNNNIRIDDEIISCTGTTATSFVGCTRGDFSSTAVSHVLGSTIRDVYAVIEHDDSNANIYITESASTNMQIGVNRIPQAALDIYVGGPTTNELLFRVGSSNLTEQFAIRDQAATGFTYGIIPGGLYIGSAVSGAYCINTPQAFGNKLCIWDALGNATWNATSINLQTSGGKVGIGTTTPAFTMDVNGSLSLEPIAAPTIGSYSGAIWNDSTQKATSVATNSITQNVTQTLLTLKSQNVVQNTVTETSAIGTLSGTSVGTTTLPANFWVAGKTVDIKMGGVYGTKTIAPGNLTIKVKWGSTVLASETLNALLSAASGAGWDGDVAVTCLSLSGGNCTFSVMGHILYAVANPAATNLQPIYGDINNSGNTTSASVTSSQRLDLTMTWATADVANIATTTTVIIHTDN